MKNLSEKSPSIGSFATAVGVGIAYGNPYGALAGTLVGGLGMAAEGIHDGYNYVMPIIQQGIYDLNHWNPLGH